MTDSKIVDRFIEIAEKDPIKAYRLLELIDTIGKLSQDEQSKVADYIKILSLKESKEEDSNADNQGNRG